MEQHTKEPQYDPCVELAARNLATLGLMSNFTWHEDPKRLTFLLARYKFAAKMFSSLNRVLEVGCADAFATRIVLQEVKSLTACDFDPVFVQDVLRRMDPRWKFDCIVHDMLAGPVPGGFDGVYSMDVIEHIPASQEERFVGNMARSLNPLGVCLIGSPSLSSQAYASRESKLGHVNCKDAPGLKALMTRFFHNVFIFSMNDEVVHTGFHPMAHYLLALCCHRKSF
jgi:SAM-dependent methyltransferase